MDLSNPKDQKIRGSALYIPFVHTSYFGYIPTYIRTFVREAFKPCLLELVGKSGAPSPHCGLQSHPGQSATEACRSNDQSALLLASEGLGSWETFSPHVSWPPQRSSLFTYNNGSSSSFVFHTYLPTIAPFLQLISRTLAPSPIYVSLIDHAGSQTT